MVQQLQSVITNYQNDQSSLPNGNSIGAELTTPSAQNQPTQQQPSHALHSHVMQTLAANHIQVPHNVRVEFAQDEPAHSIWINVLNASTGQVVFKFPPETIRLMSQHNQATGLTTDIRA